MQWLIDLVIAAIGIPPVYIPRTGAFSRDFENGDFTIDNDWHDLDLSGILPEGAKAANIHIRAAAPVASAIIRLKNSDQPTATSTCRLRTQVANIDVGMTILVGVDADRKIQYKITVSNWTNIYITIRGWCF